jgi:hypothetical protein
MGKGFGKSPHSRTTGSKVSAVTGSHIHICIRRVSAHVVRRLLLTFGLLYIADRYSRRLAGSGGFVVLTA